MTVQMNLNASGTKTTLSFDLEKTNTDTKQQSFTHLWDKTNHWKLVGPRMKNGKVAENHLP